MKFKQLKTGDTFDFISGTTYDSFYLRCEKISLRRYKDEIGTIHKVGTINCDVYHVK